MMDYRFVPSSEDLTVERQEVLSWVMDRFKNGVDVRTDEINGHIHNYLRDRNYLGYKIKDGLYYLVPTKKSLALWRDE